MSSLDLHPIDDPVDDLELAMDALAKQYLAGLSHEELGSRCVRLEKSRGRLDGIIAVGMAEAERAGTAVRAGQRTMAQYVASRTHCAPETIRADARVGGWVGNFAVFEEALLAGKLTRKHINLLRESENIRVFADMQRDQHMFIDFAEKLEWTGFKNTVKYWLMVNDQDGPKPEDVEAKNTCSIHTDADGRVTIKATLDPVRGEILKRHLDLETGQLFNQDTEDGTIRTPTQRRAAALGNLAERGAGRSETSAQPLIHVVMSLKVLMNALAQLAKPPHEQDFTSVLDANDIDGRCERIELRSNQPFAPGGKTLPRSARKRHLGAKLAKRPLRRSRMSAGSADK